MHHVNNLRGVAILLIIFTHCISVFHGQSDILRAIDAALGNGTIYFVAIAGYLFSCTTDDFHFGTYMKSKVRTVIIPYVLLSIPAVLLYVLGLKQAHVWMDMEWFSSLNPAVQVGFLYITGAHLGPLWFVPMIMLIYLASPVLVLLKNKSALLWGALAITLVAGLIADRPQHDNNPLLSALYFSPAFILGMLLAYIPSAYRRLGLVSVLVSAGLLIATSIVPFTSEHYEFKARILLVLSLMMTVSLFGLFYRYMNFRTRWLDLFARISFFLFFIHGYFVAVLRELYPAHIPVVPWPLGLPVAFAFVLSLCVMSFVVLKMILMRRSRYFIAA